MKLYIEKETLVEDVKNFFTSNYPYLKIEFYKLKEVKENRLKKEPLPPNYLLSRFLKNFDNVIIDSDKEITVEQLESQFEKIGLGTEVFRRSGTVWVETSLTDNWTLQQQNQEAEEMDNIRKIF